MHPTPEEQLRAIERRLAEVVEAEPSLSASSRQALDDARRLLRRLEGSLAKRLPFLQADNVPEKEHLQSPEDREHLDGLFVLDVLRVVAVELVDLLYLDTGSMDGIERRAGRPHRSGAGHV